MMGKPVVSSIREITLITLQNCPSSMAFSATVFRHIASLGINVDMISLAPTQGAFTTISFTINDNDLGKLLPFTADLHGQSNIKTVVSGGNCKINIYDEDMVNTPGVAAKVFTAASAVETDLRIITTSDIDISILVTEAEFDETIDAIQKGIL